MRVRDITCVAGIPTKSRPLSRYAVGSRPSIWDVSHTYTSRCDVVAEVSLHGHRWLTPSFHVWVTDSGRFRSGFIRREGNVVLRDSFFLVPCRVFSRSRSLSSSSQDDMQLSSSLRITHGSRSSGSTPYEVSFWSLSITPPCHVSRESISGIRTGYESLVEEHGINRQQISNRLVIKQFQFTHPKRRRGKVA